MPDRSAAPLLTVVLIAYNMARELPRTIRSLSATMQRDIAAADYEILLVDNGSTAPFDESLCLGLADNLRIIYMQDATASPVPAINRGLAEARGELVGVFIDGARMASPGLLAQALAASRTHPRPVIGTLSFHLGPDIQSRSIARGYNQAVEDQLLTGCGWPDNGYRLFGISVLANSSIDGWFVVPAETNALFLKRRDWATLEGFDEGFVSPGGGLANLDAWARACALRDGRVIMLLGEATFHQVHGGIATNSTQSKWKEFHDEYIGLRNRSYERPRVEPQLFGTLENIPRPLLQQSLDRYNELEISDASRH